jgi:hypothetical protein
MARPTAQDVFDTDLASLPPITRAVRESWGVHTPHPVASAAGVAALFAGLHELEQRVIALES